MSEAHTADLGTRYRYRQEGAENERERIIKIIKQAQLAAMSANGGYDKDTLEAFGQSWPPVPGWKSKLIKLINGEVKDGS
jgi:hypothetical protein